jgi:hypothetical protein
MRESRALVKVITGPDVPSSTDSDDNDDGSDAEVDSRRHKCVDAAKQTWPETWETAQRKAAQQQQEHKRDDTIEQTWPETWETAQRKAAQQQQQEQQQQQQQRQQQKKSEQINGKQAQPKPKQKPVPKPQQAAAGVMPAAGSSGVSDWLQQLRASRQGEAASTADQAASSKGAVGQQPAPKGAPAAGLQRPIPQEQQPWSKHTKLNSSHVQQQQQQRSDRGWQGVKRPAAGNNPDGHHHPHPAAGKPAGAWGPPGSAKLKAPKQVAATEKQPLRTRAEGGRKRRKKAG